MSSPEAPLDLSILDAVSQIAEQNIVEEENPDNDNDSTSLNNKSQEASKKKISKEVRSKKM